MREDPPPSPIDLDAIDIWVVNLGGSDDEVTTPPIDEWFGSILSAEELTRAKRLVRPRDRLRFARCRAALREITGHLQGVMPSSVRFGAGPFGKPQLEHTSGPSSTPSLEFNVSHSGDLALVATSRSRTLGVDLEQIREMREVDRIVSSFFTETEQAQFAEVDAAGRDAAFMRGWTRKEAVLKGIGRGLAGGPSRYETMFATSVLTRAFQPATPRPTVDGWMLWEAEVSDGYVATLAASIERVR